jgi:CRP-like cAMP-binding protein
LPCGFGWTLCYPMFAWRETRTMQNPTGSAQQQLMPLLQGAKNPLQYLTQNDWALIIDRAKRLSFKRDEKLISQGKQARTVYVLGAGKVSIAVSGTRIAQIGPGEICGEMAFLEDSVASATATAEEEVEAYALEWTILQDLFELFPHLASRFYRSVAVNLSRRLREQIVAK